MGHEATAKDISAQFGDDDVRVQLLQEAVQSVAIGFTIYDPEDRLVMCNEAYREIYATSRDLIVPGATFEDIVRKGAERGQYKQAAGDIDTFVRERVYQHQNPTGQPIEQELDDGRWLLIVEHKTPSGYLVGNRFDITKSKKAEQALHLYSNIFEQSGEAILVTDNYNRIVSVNLAFTRLTGYSLEDVQGKNPRILSSDRTPPETYQSMWASLNQSGFWQGELWDRSKSGSIYPKWTSISVVRNSSGDIKNYFASFTDISDRKAAEEHISRLAHYDMLTGLFNRFSLQERLAQAMASAYRERQQLAVMFIDMDRFKYVNDTRGHHVGDQLLIQVAQRLLACVRQSDIVARLGGDEFVVVLTSVGSGIVGASAVAEKILASLGSPYLINGHDVDSTPSIGISTYPTDGATAEILMKSADMAMYCAKSKGRNNAQFFNAAMMDVATRNQARRTERE